MSDQFVGEIRLFAGNYAPEGWAFCDGTVLTISGHDTLYAVLGVTYGGDGITNFALPDLRSRAPMHQGQGTGLTNRIIGSKFGSETATVSINQLASHSHTFVASSGSANLQTISGNVLAVTPTSDNFYVAEPTDPTLKINLVNGVVSNTGGGGLHDNRMQYLALNYIIALNGYFPQQQ